MTALKVLSRPMPNNAELESGGGIRGPVLTKHQYNIDRQRSYRATEAGKAVYRRYNKSESRKKSLAKYRASAGGMIMRRLWDRRPEVTRKKSILRQIRRQNGR